MYANIVEMYANAFGVEYVDKTAGREYSIMKEKIGEAYLEQNEFFKFFTWYQGHEWVRDRGRQLKGTDVIIHTKQRDIFIDIKICIGENYNMRKEDLNVDPFTAFTMKEMNSPAIPLEIRNKGKDGKWRQTNTNDKMTHYMLYVVMDKHGVRHHLIRYDKIVAMSENQPLKYKVHTSREGSAKYIKVPISEFK